MKISFKFPFEILPLVMSLVSPLKNSLKKIPLKNIPLKIPFENSLQIKMDILVVTATYGLKTPLNGA